MVPRNGPSPQSRRGFYERLRDMPAYDIVGSKRQCPLAFCEVLEGGVPRWLWQRKFMDGVDRLVCERSAAAASPRGWADITAGDALAVIRDVIKMRRLGEPEVAA